MTRRMRPYAAASLTAVLLAGCAVGGAGTAPSSAPEDREAGATAATGPTGTAETSETTDATDATDAPTETERPTRRPAGRDTAAAVLVSLPVKGRSAMTGYDRDAFGQAWLDADRNGCDTRNDVLGEQLEDPSFKPGTRDCKVLAGLLEDPYTGQTILFDDADGDGSGIDVDHVVALGNAWVTGAAGRDVPELAALANDPLNLLAVDAGANRSKGDGDAATWLPPRRAVRCAYVARQVAVKAKYALWVTAAERAAIARVLDDCPAQALPADSGAPTRVSFLDADGGRSTCADLAARGLTPVRRGEPAYDPGLDGDGDGVACE